MSSESIAVTTTENVTTISGNLSFDTSDMIPVSKYESWVSIDKIKEKCHPIMPGSIDWSTVNRNSWFICIRPDNGMNYSFPIAESENRDNDFERVKKGISYFYEQKYLIYSIGS